MSCRLCQFRSGVETQFTLPPDEHWILTGSDSASAAQFVLPPGLQVLSLPETLSLKS